MHSTKMNYINDHTTAALWSKAADATKAFKNLNKLEVNYLQIKKDNVDNVISLHLELIRIQLRYMLLKK